MDILNDKYNNMETRKTASELLDDLIGEGGIQTKISMDFTKETYIKLGTTIVMSGVIILGISYLAKAIMGK